LAIYGERSDQTPRVAPAERAKDNRHANGGAADAMVSVTTGQPATAELGDVLYRQLECRDGKLSERMGRNSMPDTSNFSRIGAAQCQQKSTTFPNRHFTLSIWNRYIYTAVAILMLNTLIVSACFELVARGVFAITRMIPKLTEQLAEEEREENSRRKVSYYLSQDWAEQYWYEHGQSRTQRYYPYVGWRRAPFKGKTIEIDQNGVRVTPGADCSATSFKVFTFGASEMWGTGSPNQYTISANLQKGLEKLRQGPVCVMNFAESAYVSMQDVIMLLMQLRSGNVPDLVLFYNIGSDVYAAYQSGRAGVLQNLNQLAARFEGRRGPYTFVDWLRSTYSYALIDKLTDALTIAHPQQEAPTPSTLVTYESMGIDVGKLSDAIVQHYLGNTKIVSGLAQKYGFKYFFFVPPRIFRGNKPLTSEEQHMKHKTENEAAFYKLYTAVYQTLERESAQYQNLYSLVHIFDHYEALIWIDAAHVTPIGNQLIAERMLEVMQAQSPDEK
jgi:hypothetical protein